MSSGASRSGQPRRHEAAPALNDRSIGLEARAHSADRLDSSIWLRLLACSAQIERMLRSLLRQRFATTLLRFDYLAQLERRPDGLRMSAPGRMMATGGNVTGLTDPLGPAQARTLQENSCLTTSNSESATMQRAKRSSSRHSNRSA